MKRNWFENKIFGWGWVPISWQGWALTLAYMTIVCGIAIILFLLINDPRIFIWLFIPLALACSAYMTKLAYDYGEKPEWPWDEE